MEQLYILDPSIQYPELGSFNSIAALSPFSVCYHLVGLIGMQTIVENEKQKRNPSGIIILGSKANVDEDRPWQRPLIEWLKLQISAEVPIFGICYGHQLLAHIFGAEVSYISEHKRALRGFREVSILKDSRLGIEPQDGAIVVSHAQVVKSLPRDMEAFASSKSFPIDGLRHKSFPIWSVQSHPEATALFCEPRNIPFSKDGPSPFLFGHNLVSAFLKYVGSRKVSE